VEHQKKGLGPPKLQAKKRGGTGVNCEEKEQDGETKTRQTDEKPGSTERRVDKVGGATRKENCEHPKQGAS